MSIPRRAGNLSDRGDPYRCHDALSRHLVLWSVSRRQPLRNFFRAIRRGNNPEPQPPRRSNGRLSSLNALEYGAQAAAIHGGLRARAAGMTAPACYLAALRDAHLYVDRLDDLASPLEVRAQRLFGDAGNTIYKCAVSASGTPVVEGRVTIMLRP